MKGRGCVWGCVDARCLSSCAVFQHGGCQERVSGFVGSGRCRSKVQRLEEEEALGGRRGKGTAVPSKSTWVGAAETRGREGLSGSLRW
jgi:hypothetical protein